MDALTIFGAVVGAIDMCSKIYQSVDCVVSQIKNAPDVAREVLSEVKVMQTSLKAFQHILDTKPTIPKSVSSKLSVGALSDVVEDCVRTLDLLRETVKPLGDPDQGRLALYERFQWAMVEKKVVKLLERLQRVQTCLQSMVILCTGHAMNEVTTAVSNLNSNLPKVRLHLPRRPFSNHSSGTSNKSGSPSLSPVSDCPKLPKFEFEEELHESTVYRRARGSECDRSVDGSVVNGGTWSKHGSDIPSVISVLALPLAKSELANPEPYSFSSEHDSQIPSRPVSHLTLDALQSMARPGATSATAHSPAPTAQTTNSSVSAEGSGGRRSFSDECEGLLSETGDGAVLCMGSLYFNEGTEVWPSASKVGAQLSNCASSGLLDDFICSYCTTSLGNIVKSRRDHWAEHSVFCRPCGQQLRALHGSAFCPCTSPTPRLYVKYYNFSSSMSLVRCATCFSCCFGCSRPRLTPKHKRQATPTELRIKPRAVSHSRSRTGLNSHRRNTSEDSTGSAATAATSVSAATRGPSPAPYRLRRRPHPSLPLLPSPPTSPLDDAIPEDEAEFTKVGTVLSPSTVLRDAMARGLQTPPDSAQNTSHSESEGEYVAEMPPLPPPGHKPSGSRDYIMRIPDDTRDALMLRKTHKASSSISKVYFKDKSAPGQQAQELKPPLYWGGRILFHHDAGPCLKLLYNIPPQLQDKYRKGQFALAGKRGLLDSFRCKACHHDLWTILGRSTAPDRFLSYFMWCGRPGKCTAVDADKVLTCQCHKRGGPGRLHVGFLDALSGRIVAFCSDCFELCRNCRANGNKRNASTRYAPSTLSVPMEIAIQN